MEGRGAAGGGGAGLRETANDENVVWEDELYGM